MRRSIRQVRAHPRARGTRTEHTTARRSAREGEDDEPGDLAPDGERDVLSAIQLVGRGRPERPARVFCPIWRNPWMTVGPDTYAHDLLGLCGGANVFAHRHERRYPVVREEELLAAAPEVVLLPDEPYAFGPEDAASVRRLAIPAAAAGRVHLIDGTLVSWYGPRIRRAIETLRPLLAVT